MGMLRNVELSSIPPLDGVGATRDHGQWDTDTRYLRYFRPFPSPRRTDAEQEAQVLWKILKVLYFFLLRRANLFVLFSVLFLLLKWRWFCSVSGGNIAYYVLRCVMCVT